MSDIVGPDWLSHTLTGLLGAGGVAALLLWLLKDRIRIVDQKFVDIKKDLSADIVNVSKRAAEYDGATNLRVDRVELRMDRMEESSSRSDGTLHGRVNTLQERVAALEAEIRRPQG